MSNYIYKGHLIFGEGIFPYPYGQANFFSKLIFNSEKIHIKGCWNIDFQFSFDDIQYIVPVSKVSKYKIINGMSKYFT
jgi:hypothetical protein